MEVIQDKTIEDSVIGSILMINEIDFPDILTGEIFYDVKNKEIFNAINSLQSRSMPVDALSVYNEVKILYSFSNVSAHDVIVKTNNYYSQKSFERHCAILYELYVKRKMRDTAQSIIENAMTPIDDVFDFHNNSCRQLENIVNLSNSNTHTFESMEEKFQVFNERVKNSGELSGVTTGFYEMDAQMGGWQKSDLIILAARPSMGKTALSIAYIINALEKGKKVIFFSLEMSADLIYKRIASCWTETNLTAYNLSGLNRQQEERHKEFKERFSKWRLVLNDKAGINLNEMNATLRKNKDTDLVVVDYLQIMSAEEKKNSSRNDEVGRLSGGLKRLAKNFQVPVVALSQLSRSVEQRGGNKIPMLSDLRDSGSIEQDADVIQFIYRPEYYGIMEDEEGNSNQGVALIINAKNRNGATGVIQLKWEERITKFKNRDSFNNSNQFNPSDFTQSKKENDNIFDL
jgi:replicative DNA helicase